MNSPTKLDKKNTIKNEDDRISNNSSKKTATSNGFPTNSKSTSSKNASANSKDEKRQSGFLSISSIDNTKERRKSSSPQKRHGKSTDKNENHKKVTFRKKFIETVIVESYKKYNVDLSYNDPINSNENSKCRKMQDDLEKNFEDLAQEMTRTYLQNTQKKYSDIEENIYDLQKTAAQKVLSKCGDIVTKITHLSENINNIDSENNTMTITLKPRDGEEKEFAKLTSELMECSSPYLSVLDYALKNKTYFDKLNSSSFSLCLNDCKTNLLNKKYTTNKGDINFNELKYCLKDCYNLTSFNFRSYHEYFSQGIANDLEELKKL